MPSSHQSYISTQELARLLGVSSVTVFKRIQKGQIKAVKIGRSYAIPRRYVEENFPNYKIQAPIQGEYYSVMEAAELLGVSRVAIFKQIKNGKIPAQRIGRHYVIERSVLSDAVPDKPATSTTESTFYSIPEVADILGISRIAVFKRVQQGKIPATRVGRHYVIAHQDVYGGDKPSTRTAHDQYVSIAEAAKILGISRIAVFKQVQKQKLKAIRMGRSYAIPRTELYKNNE